MKEYYKLLQEIKKGRLKSVYFLDGDELFLKDRIIEQIKVACEKKSSTGINIKNYYSKDTRIEDLEPSLNELSLFGRNLVVIKDFEHAGSDIMKSVKKFISHSRAKAEPDNILVLYTTERIGNKKITKMDIGRIDEYLILWKLFPGEMKKWIVKYVSEAGKSMRNEDAELILNYLGLDMYLVENELKKLIIFSDKKRIDSETIRSVITNMPENDVYRLFDLITTRQKKKALKVLEDVVEYNPNNPGMIFNMLFWNLKQVINLRSLKEKGKKGKQVRESSSLKGKSYERLLRLSNFYDRKRISKSVLVLESADKFLKSYSLNNKILLEKLIIDLIEI